VVALDEVAPSLVAELGRAACPVCSFASSQPWTRARWYRLIRELCGDDAGLPEQPAI